ncbi:hypothetical protein [Salinivibrio proteolyticus]|uniref:hypothetical protein n=1 Tax=Salinivibrio proteolyticus TaxID=334715 RepID=UPI001E3728E1|nr:hypothetical protein [Salinivibrio proteolyticus]
MSFQMFRLEALNHRGIVHMYYKKRKKEKSLRGLSSTAANISQVIMVALVAFGYFYTIKPVYQKEKVAEELARLEIEKSSWEDDLNETKRELKIKTAELNKINKERELIEDEIAAIKLEIRKATQDAKEIASEYKNTKRQLQLSRQTIEQAKSLIVKQLRDQILGNMPIPQNMVESINRVRTQPATKLWEVRSSKAISDMFKDPDSFFKERTQWKPANPIKAAEFVLEDINNLVNSASGIEKKAKKEFYNQYKNSLEEKKSLLACQHPEMEEWKAAFISASKIAKKHIDICIRNSPQSDITAPIHCRYNVNDALESVFREKWNKAINPCESRLRDVNDIILESSRDITLPPFLHLDPPQMSLVEYRISSALSNDSK